jgi:UDP-3-O-[3-hydroxymyristoyl] glucosamine N-acyltransferase
VQDVGGRSLAEVARLVGGELAGDPTLVVRGLAPLEQAEPGDLSFVTGPRYQAAAERSRASAFLVPPGLELPGRAVIRVPEPALAMARLLRLFHPEVTPVPGVHPTAVVADSARVAADATVLAYAVVGPDSVVESRAVMHPHVVLREDVEVGRGVVVHAGAVLGADGFGYVFDGTSHRKIPQVGRVVVEDDVEIGANVTIDRATLGSTVVGRGTKIDNLVQIGHNTVIGADTIVVAQTGISGSCRIGSRVVLAGQVGLADHVTVGDGAQVGAQAGVHNDIPAGARVLGSPAIAAPMALRSMAALPRLPDLLKTVRALERRVADLERRAGG